MQLSLNTDTPKIYVACLAAYNSGILHGEWIDATQDLDTIWNELRNALATSPVEDAEEWAIHDYDGFGLTSLSEYESIERVHEIALFIEENEKLGASLIEHFCGNLDDAKAALENYMGCYESLEDYARQTTEETSEVPEHLAYYIDYEAMGKDIENNGDVFTISTRYDEVHIFLSH